MGLLPEGHPRALHAQSHLRQRLGATCARGAARRAPGLLAREALGHGHPARLDQPGAHARLLRRVGLPLQPPPLTQPRTAVPATPQAGRRRRRPHLPGTAQGRPDPTTATTAGPRTDAPAQPRTRTVRPALAHPPNLSILGVYGSEMETPLNK